jgi:tetraacyldisaccharide 4'-kinase
MSFGGDRLVQAWYSGAWWLWLLRPLELLFRGFSATRHWLYQREVLPVYRSPVPVIVIGNITVGGTGKTPVVIALVEALQQQSIRVGVVSRGYGARDLRRPHRVGADSAAAQCGDEPLLIQRRTGCPCVAAPDRPGAVRALLAETPVDLIVSDDGLQHYALARDMEIAMLDARRGIGNGCCLPAGPLREPAGRLQTVDFVLYRGSEDPACGVSYQPDCLVNLATGERRPASPAAIGREAQAVAGIGQPEQFFAELEGLGFKIQRYPFADHHSYTPADFAGLSDQPIIMTEKDAVKCAAIAGDNAWYLVINAQLPERVVLAAAALSDS